MSAQMSERDVHSETVDYDYSFVDATARIALYDDMRSAPRITEIAPAPTNDFIESLTTAVYEQSKLAGGKLPYTLIREVSENFIHARFKEIVVSILDEGNTIRFADQGPGIREKENARKPGFSSAVEPMKKYIRGVGSGLPIVQDYLDDKEGYISIEDNLTSGAVVTISLEKREEHTFEAIQPAQQMKPPIPSTPLTDRERLFMDILLREGDMGITDFHNLTSLSNSTTFNTLRRLEEAGLVEKSLGKKRTLTPLGYDVALSLKS